MEFSQHTINWAKGEILEAIIMGTIGLLIVVSSLLFWKFGHTPYAKAMVIPLLVVGLIPVIAGISGVISNTNRIETYQESYAQNPTAFVQAEKARVERFEDIFKYSYPAAIIMVIGGAVLFFFISLANWKAISLALMVLGVMAYFIDHFAKERADRYLVEIEKEMHS